MAPRKAVSVPHPAERTRNGRGWFEKLAEAASNITSSAPFYGFCLLLVILFVAVHIAGLPLSWQLLVGDIMTSVNLLLLALLKNSERRAEHAVQRKLDSIAAALLELKEGRPQKTGDDLRDAIRMEEEL
ncbi:MULTISPECIES: low affinity iron permease family protein [unclassified Streptomyces]|jgi:low affinity Fe/Cu permease|uniref:low affinity iron permease family protein n=1 Tax=unclassified Streptomyces TaxID=2593676 RepID=UPI00332E8E83